MPPMGAVLSAREIRDLVECMTTLVQVSQGGP